MNKLLAVTALGMTLTLGGCDGFAAPRGLLDRPAPLARPGRLERKATRAMPELRAP